MSKKEIFFLAAIFIFAFILRFIGQPKYPSCLHRDEVQFAYNAYSISETGKDEWGEFLPFHFKFNGEYHVPSIFYLAALVMKFTGPIDTAVRLPAIILGSLIPILAYGLTKFWFKNHKISLALALLLTINPWQIINSRGSGQISIISLFFGLTGFYLLFKFLNTKFKITLLLALLSFLAAYFSYIASRLDIPFLLIAFIAVYLKKIPYKKFTIPLIISVIALPFILVAVYPKRFVATSTIAKHFFPEEPERQKHVKSLYEEGKKRFFITQGRAVFFETLDNYFDYISPYYIFRNLGEPNRTNVDNTGSLFLVESLFVLIGFYALSRLSKKPIKQFLALWIFLSPIAGSLTYNNPDRPNSARSVYFYFGLSIVSAYGLVFLYNFFKKRNMKTFILIGIVFLFAANGIFFKRQLTIYSDPKLSAIRDCGWKELFNLTEKIKNKYKNIYIGTVFDYPYIKHLWYTKYPPQKYHQFIEKQPENIPVFIHTQDKSDWQMEEYIYTHDACPIIKDTQSLLVGNFEDCRNKNEIAIYEKEGSNQLIFVLPGNEILVFKHVNSIIRADNNPALSLYVYESELNPLLIDLKKTEEFIPLN